MEGCQLQRWLVKGLCKGPYDSDDPSHDGRHAAADHLIGTEDACGHDTDAGFCCAAVGV